MSSSAPRWSATRRSSPFDNCLSCDWEGDKGETYTIATSGSDKSWVCTRRGYDGASKRFTLELDKAAGTIWWGIAGAYYCDVFNEASEGQLSWYKPNARKPSFVWWVKAGTKKQEDSTLSWSRSWTPSASGGAHEWKPTVRHETAVPKARTSSVVPTPAAQKLQTKRWTEENGDKQMDQAAAKEVPGDSSSSLQGDGQKEQRWNPCKDEAAKVEEERRLAEAAAAVAGPMEELEERAAEEDFAKEEQQVEDKVAENKTAEGKPAEENATEKAAEEKAAEEKPVEEKAAEEKAAEDKAAEGPAEEEQLVEDKEESAVREEQHKDQPSVNDRTQAPREAGAAVRQLLHALKMEFEKKAQSRATEARLKEQPTILTEAPVAVALDTQSQHSPVGCSHDFTLPPGLEVPPGLERPRQAQAAASSEWLELSPPPGLPVWPASPQGTHLSKSDDETRIGSDQSSHEADDLDYSVDPVDSEQPVLPLLSASPQQPEAHKAQKQAVQAPAPEQLQLHFAKLHLWTQPHQLEQPQQPAKIQLGSAQQPAKPQLQPARALQAAPQTMQPMQTQETLADAHEFFITLDKTDGTKLGVTLDRADGSTLHIDSISNEGLFKRWNDGNPGLSVKPTDRIVEANGVRGKVGDVIAELKQDRVLRLLVLRTKGQAQETLAKEPQVGKTEKLTTSTSTGQVVGKAEKETGKDTDKFPRTVSGADKGGRQKARQQHQFAVGPVAIPTAVDAAKQAALATHATTRAGRRVFYGGSWPRGLLDGRWNDACGEVGRIRGETMIWSHPVVGMTSTKVEHNGHYVRLNFLGQTLCGVFGGNQIHWSESDVWWRHPSEF